MWTVISNAKVVQNDENPCQTGIMVNDKVYPIGGSGGGSVHWNNIAGKPMEQITEEYGPADESVTFVKDSDKYKATFTGGDLLADADMHISILGIPVINSIMDDCYTNADENGNVYASGERFNQNWAVTYDTSMGEYTVEIWGGDIDSITESEFAGRVDIDQNIVVGEQFSSECMPKMECVPDAEGDTVTAAEFNALLSALRDAGYMRDE